MSTSSFYPPVSEEDMRFLRELTSAVIDSSIVRKNAVIVNNKNRIGIDFIRPGGRDDYPALWIRDFVMSLESGLIPPEISYDMFRCIAEHQSGENLEFPAGGRVPAGAVPDHINLKAEPLFFPGTYSFSEQGTARWGRVPPFDNQFYFIEAAWQIPQVHFTDFAGQLELAFQCVPVNHEELVCCNPANRGVSFGFCDAIEQTGSLLWASLLRALAARRLAAMFLKAGFPEKAAEYNRIAELIPEKIAGTFQTPSGLLRSSTEISSQEDVWGSAFAVYEGLVDPACAKKIASALASAFLHGTIACRGQICHVPTDRQASEMSPWEKTQVPPGKYQNGAFWGTPTGWVAFAIYQCDPATAAKLLKEYIEELRLDDFRKGINFGAPWECICRTGNSGQNPVYMTSVTCPYAAIRKILTQKI